MRPWTAAAVRFNVLFILLHHTKFTACRDCYEMDGSVIPGDIACHSELDHSFCCGSMWTCLTQGICSDLNTTDTAIHGSDVPALQRGTCTDPTWSSDQCPQFCPTSGNQTDRGLYHCDTGDSKFCCAKTPCSAENGTCMTGVEGFVSFSQDNVPFTTIGMLGPTHTKLVTVSSSSSKTDGTVITRVKTSLETPHATDPADPQPSGTVSILASSREVPNPTVGSSATNIPPSTSPTATPGNHGHPSTSVTIGITIGIFIPIAGLISFLIWRCRARKSPATAQTPVLPKTSFEVQDHRQDKSRMGYPPAELYGRDRTSQRAELADSPRRAPYELPTVSEFVSELAQPSPQRNNTR